MLRKFLVAMLQLASNEHKGGLLRTIQTIDEFATAYKAFATCPTDDVERFKEAHTKLLMKCRDLYHIIVDTSEK
jgi:hypothetical protein